MLIVPRPRSVKELEVDGERPFTKWLHKLKDSGAKATILARITRIQTTGNFGSYRYLNEGIFELKIETGPGYRIYFGLEKDTLVLLILGGDKSSQNRDIKKANSLWQLYLNKGGTHDTKKEK